ncbi:MAG: uroporphyrinogen-III synthase [Bordetella sp.]|nr:MAG: uroporphyrinogen-III synthase [Bordetella sp.]
MEHKNIISNLAILTRPKGNNENLAFQLEKIGWIAKCLPALEIKPTDIDYLNFPFPENYDFIIFVSGSAARIYLNILQNRKNLINWPVNTKIATTGPASAKVLKDSLRLINSTILYPSLSSKSFDSEELWKILEKSEIKNKKF